MDFFQVRGVVKNGQVVLETPLDLPDGTYVTVMEYDPADYPSESTGPPSPEVRKEIILAIARRPDLADDPDWEEKLRSSAERKRSMSSELIERLAGMWAYREEMADPEAWVRQLRGRRD